MLQSIATPLMRRAERELISLLVPLALAARLLLPASAAAQTLSEAVEHEEMEWFTTGAADWIGQTTYSHDGIDAAESGSIRVGQASVLETMVTGPVGVGFWWNVSSWPHLDFLRFYIDAAEQAGITGSPGWQWTGFSVPEGPHTLRWVYSKGTSNRDGLDRGWVDEVIFTQSPFIFTGPLSHSAQPGQDATFSIFAIGAGPLSYQWSLNDSALPGATNARLSLTNVQVAQAGKYSVTVSNAFDVASAAATLTVIAFPEALETTNLIWTTGGDAPWTTQTGITHDGVDAAESGTPLLSPFADQHSILEAQTPSAGMISFFMKVSSQPFFFWDGLIIQVGQEEVLRITDGVDWTSFSLPVPERQPVRWTHFTRLVPPAEENRAWLDEVTFTPAFAPLIHRQPLSGTFPGESLVQLPVGAIGAKPLSYQWYFNGAPLPLDGTNALLTFPQARTNQSGSYFVIVSNSYGMAISEVAVIQIQALGPALDTPGLIWSTNGDAGWFSQSEMTHDRLDAAASESIGHEQFAALETIITGPGTVAFWWKVSSEKDYDLLTFYGSWADDGSGRPLIQISGETGWERRSVIVPPGDGGQILRWTYAKDATETAGLDRAWLDEVMFTPITAPVIVDQPRNQILPAGGDHLLSVTAYGAEPLAYQWRFNGVALTDATNSTLGLTAVQTAQAGEYRVVVSNEFGTVLSDVAKIDLISLTEALDNSLVWSNAVFDPDPLARRYVWRVDESTTHDGEDAVTLGPLNSDGAVLETTVTGPGFVSFWWKVSSHDCCEFFTFWIGTNSQAQIKGEVDWEYRTFAVPAGEQRLGWDYSDFVEGIPWNNDRAWVDQVSFVAAGTPPSIAQEPRYRAAWAGSDVTLIAGAIGAPTLHHQWFFNSSLAGANSATLLLTSVQPAQAGQYHAVVANFFGAVTSATATVTIIEPRLHGRFDTTGEGSDVEVAGPFAYLADGLSGVRIFDVSDPTNAVVVGSYDTPGDARGVRVSGPLAYVADSEAGVQILDISVPANIALAGSYDTKGEARSVEVDGPRLFVADGWGGVLVLDVSHPAHPTRLGGYRPAGEAVQVRIVGSLAYVAGYGSGLHILDVSNPAAIVPVGFHPAIYARELQVVGSRLFLAEADPDHERTRVHLLDISDSARIVRLGGASAVARGGSVHLRAAGDLVFFTKEDDGLELLDVSDPARIVSGGTVLRGGTLGGLQIIGRRAYLAGVEHDLTILELNGLPPTRPALRARRVTGDRFEVMMENLYGSSAVVLEFSTNLREWHPWQTNTVSGPTLLLSLPLENSSSTRYFRAMMR